MGKWSSLGKAIGAGGKASSGIIGFLVSNGRWRFTITIFFILVLLVGSVGESIKQGSITPFLKSVGGRIISADEVIYQNVNEYLSEDSVVVVEGRPVGLWDKFVSNFGKWKLVFMIIANLWFLYFMGYVFWMISITFITNNASAWFSNLVVTLLILVVLQVVYSLMVYDVDDFGGLNYSELDIGSQVRVVAPFKGIVSFVKNAPIIFLDVQKPVQTFFDDRTSFNDSGVNV